MPGLLLTARLARQCDGDLRAIAARTGAAITPLILPDDDAPLSPEVLAQVEAAYASPDSYDVGVRRVWHFLDTLGGAPNLRWAHLGWAGTDNPRFLALRARGVRLSNSPGAAAEPIAHSVMAGLLALARRFPHFAAQQRAHRWEQLPIDRRPRDLSTQTLVVYGLGAIGGEVARLAQAFGLHVIGVRRSPRTAGDAVDELVHPRDFDGVLPRADWLVVAAPRTPQTEGAISAARLALLPPHAHLINIARGRIVDEPALIEALRSGALAGAYLDVVAQEPLDPASPLWDLPNVILTPHSSWAAQGNPERARLIFLDNLECWLRGEPLPQAIAER
ncbi:MAG: D-2-hydroxyacid dehydrogenase [Chloroflexi bacterium]|nr:D-2-hydroxyacid dehydrogenase [Chloroflexota bacterium]